VISLFIRCSALVLLLALYSASSRADITIVTIQTSLGTFKLEMLTSEAPATVANFLGYVNRGDYDGTFMHRSIPGFILQAGGYRFDPLTGTAPHIDTVAPVVNEFGISSTRSTVAMAKVSGDPNSATSEWFVNLADNSQNLDNQNGGFTVFARVIDNGMEVVDAIVGLPRQNFGSSFTDTPTQNYQGVINADIFVQIIRATVQVLSDFDDDGVPDVDDFDDDNDGVPDTLDSFPFDPDRSAPANEAPALQLVGAESLMLFAGEFFDDPGVIATDQEDGNITAQVIVLSDLDVNIPGTYMLEYRVTDSGGLTSLVTRQVIVAQPNRAPVLSLTAGDFTLRQNEPYIEPGFSAMDQEDGDLGALVQITGTVDTTVQGTYVITYSVTDSAGLSTVATRTVVVYSANRIASGQVIELQVIDRVLTAPDGLGLVIPSSATAVSINVTAVTPGASGFITVWPCGVARPLASNLNFVSGDVVPNGVIAPIGSNGKVCFYSQADTDLVVDVAGWFEGDAFVGATPLRLVDTRITNRINAAESLVLKVASIAATRADGMDGVIPADVGAVALNVTVVNPDASGFITVYPCDVARPLASNVNYESGQILPNGVIAPVSANGEVCIYSLSPTDVIVDLAGWFPGDAFTAATPQRLIDTRDGTGGQSGKLTPAGQLSVLIQGQTLSVAGNSAQVPLFATAVSLNVTIVNPESSGFATVWPCSAAQPLASNLNFVAGQVIANNVIAPIGDQGSVCFFTNVPSDIIVDIAGYFSGETGNQFVGSTPERFIDTRSGLGPAPL